MEEKDLDKYLDEVLSTYEISKFEVALRALSIDKMLANQKKCVGQYIHITVEEGGNVTIDCQASGSVIIQSFHSLLKSTDTRHILTGIAALELFLQLGNIKQEGIFKKFDSREEMDVFKQLYKASDEEKERLKKELENE